MLALFAICAAQDVRCPSTLSLQISCTQCPVALKGTGNFWIAQSHATSRSTAANSEGQLGQLRLKFSQSGRCARSSQRRLSFCYPYLYVLDGELRHHLTRPTRAVRGTSTTSISVLDSRSRDSRLYSYARAPKSARVLHHFDRLFTQPHFPKRLHPMDR